MKVAKVKVMASNKTYWLTEHQADVITEMTQSGNHNSRLIPLGGDRVKLSAIKAIEIEEEPDINIAPEYFKEALRKENQGALPEPKQQRPEVITKRFYEDGSETKLGWLQLCKQAVPFIEKDFIIKSKRIVRNPKTGRDETAIELGNVFEERLVTFIKGEGYWSPAMRSVKRDGMEILHV